MVDAALKDFAGAQEKLASLGNNHLNKDVKPEHYAAVGQAFVNTLSDALGDDFTDELKNDWVTLYTMIMEVMAADHYN